MKFLNFIAVLFIATFLFSCGSKENNDMTTDQNNNDNGLDKKIEAYAPVDISADLSHLTDRQQQLIAKLVEAGQLADSIFWRQSCPDAMYIRDSLAKAGTDEAKQQLEYVLINYGPYDVIYDNERFTGEGAKTRPKGGAYYPEDMTKEEFEKYIGDNPNLKEDFQSQYTIIKRDDNGKLTAVPFSKAYPEVERLAQKLDEAAALADDLQLKKYLELRAKAVRSDDYYESDMAWMDLKDNDIDVIIGPIENYQDAMYNFKTAYEAVVMVKDKKASEELEMFRRHIDEFEKRLPYDKKYIRESAGGDDNILQVVNVVYFGGDCQKGTKTIAASLPNDPRVHAAKGGKKTMYKNMMEAKFEKIVMPISRELLVDSLQQYVDRDAFTSFVTLHEITHTLGRGYVFGNDSLPVRKALEERYSAIEETKADIVGLYNMKHLLDLGEIDQLTLKKTMATFVAGLYRSIRFGAESAHGTANMIQLNWLKEKGAIKKNEQGKYYIDEANFWTAVESLSNRVLTLQAQGDKAAAEKLIADYGKLSDEVKSEIDKLKNIPRDINTKYTYVTQKQS